MPRVGQGNEAVNFPYDAEGIKAAEKYAQATGQQVDYSEQASEAPGMRSNISLGYEEGGKVPTSDGAARSVQTYPGGGMTGYNIMDKYETGGKAKAAKMQKTGKAKKKETGKKQKPISDKLRKIIEDMEGIGKKTPKQPWEPKKPYPWKTLPSKRPLPGDKPPIRKPMPGKPSDKPGRKRLLRKKK